MKKEKLLKCYGDSCVTEGKKHQRESLNVVSHKNYCPSCYPIALESFEERQKQLCYGENCFFGTNNPANKKHKKEELQEVNGVNYCPSCFEKAKKDRKDFLLLKGVLDNIFGDKFSSNRVLVDTQVKQFRDKSMSYVGIYWTLNFMYNVEQIKFDHRGIALVPYYYDRARDWLKEQQRLKKNSEGFEIKEANVVVSKVKPSKKYIENKLLSMEDL